MNGFISQVGLAGAPSGAIAGGAVGLNFGAGVAGFALGATRPVCVWCQTRLPDSIPIVTELKS